MRITQNLISIYYLLLFLENMMMGCQKMFFPHTEVIFEKSRKFYLERYLLSKSDFLKKRLIWRALFLKQLEILRK